MNIKEYIASQLNDEQTKATLHTETSSLIIAGAGSGKTRVLTYKIAYLIRGLQTLPQRVLAVTFTNKAANEMKERLKGISQEMNQLSQENKLHIDSPTDQKEETPKIGNDIDDFLQAMQSSAKTEKGIKELRETDLKRIGTFHSIFLKILKEDIDKLQLKYNKNFGILDTNDTQSVIKDILKHLNLNEIFKPQEAKSFISTQKNNGRTPKDFLRNGESDYDQTMGKVYEEYQKVLETSNSLDFDDLLLLPYQLFKKNPETLQKRQNHFDYILVDEAQDTNRIQFELMKMMSGDKSKITLIGDDFQSIYGRRGALMENFLNVKMYRPDIQMFKLQINYRSKPHIVEAGNTIIKNNQNQYEKNIIAHRQGDDKITIFSHNSEMDEAANIIELIKKMKNSDKLKSRGQVAILYRTNSQSGPFEQILIQEGVPYKIRGAFKFFERKEIRDALAYLKYFLNPQDNVSLKRIINIPNRKVGKTSFEKIEEWSIQQNISLDETIERFLKKEIPTDQIKLTPQAINGILDFKESTNQIKQERPKCTPSDLIELLVKKIKYKDFLIKEEGETQGEEKYDNIGQLINMAQKYPESGEEALRQFMEEVTLLSDISENEKGDIDAIKLMTVHSSKGLEFPVVFVAGLEDHIFPLSNAMLEPKLLEEERRLMYVAVTRAKDVLFLSHAHSRMTRGQTKMNPPSRFLDEVPADLTKKYDLSGGSSYEKTNNISEGDTVRHKLFGTGYVLETRNNACVVKFHNPKFGLRRVENRFLDVI